MNRGRLRYFSGIFASKSFHSECGRGIHDGLNPFEMRRRRFVA